MNVSRAYISLFASTIVAFLLLGAVFVVTSSASNGINAIDEAGVLITEPGGGTNVTEGGSADTYQVVLTEVPTGTVTIDITPDAETMVDLSTLTFLTTTWDITQTVSVTAVDDDVVEGSHTSLISHSASGGGYDGVTIADVSANITDNDTAGVTVAESVGSTAVIEGGATDSYTVVLDAEPSDTVNVTISTDGQTTALPSPLTFLTSNWDDPQTVTVTAEDDSIAEGPHTSTITHSASGGSYDGVMIGSVSADITDNDGAGVNVVPTDIMTGEDGTTDSFAITLDSEPTDDVTISITSSDLNEGTVSTASVVLTPGNWETGVEVTVTGEDDPVVDGDQSYTITTGSTASTDGNYNGLDVADISATNADDDIIGVNVDPTNITTVEDGSTDSFTISLDSEPTDVVTITITSSNTAEGTVSTPSVTLDSGNWQTGVEVTVTGVDDLVDDGDQAYTITTDNTASGDGNYDGLDVSDVSATNTDDDDAGVNVSPTAITTGEDGTTGSFTITLDSEPTGDVTISITSSDLGEGTVSTGSVVLTPGNWETGVEVTVTGVDDFIDEIDQAYTIITGNTVSDDDNYDGHVVTDVTATNTDDDVAGIFTIPDSGLLTTEAGITDTLTVTLTSEPTANVTINVSSSDTTEGTVSPLSLTFTDQNWDEGQTVTVTGVDDDLGDTNEPYTVILSASSVDDFYDNLADKIITATNSDNDLPGITVNPNETNTTLFTSEPTPSQPAGEATFTIFLNTQPDAPVTIPLASSVPTEGIPDVTELTFTVDNWAEPQTVTVTGQDDPAGDPPNDGDIPYEILVGPAQAPGETTGYDGMDTFDVSLVNFDRDGIIIEWSEPVVSHQEEDPDEFLGIIVSYNGPVITLEISSSQMDKIASVKFYRWDYKQEKHIDIATVIQPPFRTTISPKDLLPGYNQLWAVAYDEENNESPFHPTFFIFKPHTAFMPIINH